MSSSTIRRVPGIDWILLVATLALLVLGTLLVWSATSARSELTGSDSQMFLRKQLVNVGIGLVLMMLVMATDHRWVRLLAPIAYLASVGGLVMVLVGGVTINGVPHAVRWVGSSGTATDLGAGVALGTNANGSVIVGSDNSGAAVVWNGTTRQTLAAILGSNSDLTGATLKEAVAVSDDGKVVSGTALISGKQRAFMARLP